MQVQKNLKIVVVYGGNSSERPGSIMSGRTIIQLLRDAGYTNVTGIDLTPNNIHKLINAKPDFVFIALHGPFGEDGRLQGLLESIDIPHSTSSVSACAISQNKALFNKFVKSLGFKAPNQISINSINELKSLKLNFPKVIKPASQGCSYGVFYVKDKIELLEKAKFSLKFDENILIEDYIPGRELSIGIFEDINEGSPHVLPIVEFSLKHKIYDYETKYPGGEDLYKTILPAKMETSLKKKIKRICKEIFVKLGCHGFIRMDARLTTNNELFILENNIIPGMLNLEESDFPKLLKAGGVKYTDFIDSIILSSMQNYQKEHRKAIPSEKEMVKYLGLKLAS